MEKREVRQKAIVRMPRLHVWFSYMRFVMSAMFVRSETVRLAGGSISGMACALRFEKFWVSWVWQRHKVCNATLHYHMHKSSTLA